jgi:exodeoxyribonuclease III
VNSIRVRLNQLEAVIKKHNPAIIGLQETKVTDEDFPVEEINDLGYDVAFHGQKTHYGVALLYRNEATDIRKGFTTDDKESQTVVPYRSSMAISPRVKAESTRQSFPPK